MKRVLHERYGYLDGMTLDASIAGPEVIEGFTAFSERRAPGWIPPGFEPEGRL